MRRAAAEQIPLTLCPTSNVVIANRYASLAEHPLPAIRAAGIPFTINTDDPAMMQSDLGQEYRQVSEALGISAAELAEVAVDGIATTFLDPADQALLVREFRSHLASAATST